MADDKQNGSDMVDKAAVEVAQMALETHEDVAKPAAASKEAAHDDAGSKGATKKEENGTPKAAPVSTAAFKEQFKAFSKFGDTKSDGKHLTLSQSDKWMKQAKVIDKKITTTDTGIHFKKLKSMKLSFTEYNTFL